MATWIGGSAEAPRNLQRAEICARQVGEPAKLLRCLIRLTPLRKWTWAWSQSSPVGRTRRAEDAFAVSAIGQTRRARGEQRSACRFSLPDNYTICVTQNAYRQDHPIWNPCSQSLKKRSLIKNEPLSRSITSFSSNDSTTLCTFEAEPRPCLVINSALNG